MSNPIVMYIIVNNDLKMSSGKIASQVGHVVQLITEELIRKAYESLKPDPEYITYMKWRNDCTKIVLKATTEQLHELQKLKNARYIIDSGQTQIAPNSLTVVGFYPSNMLADTMKDFKLL